MPFPQSDIAKQRFLDIDLIGKGAFGNVYRAVDQRLRRTIAIKEIQATLSPGDYEAARHRFEHEAQIVAQLSSPHIVAVYGYDADVQQGEEYLYLEYVPHGTLAAAVREQGRLTERDAALVARDIVRAIAAHWSVRVVHRDIKPSNILLTCDENGAITGAKLTDYGIAQDLQATQRTRIGQGHPGTPSYMSPEQATSQRALTAASDIYNVGLLLWEMLTGTPYYEQQASSITKTQLGSSQRLAQIVQRTLEPDLAKRYADPRELVQDIETVLAKLSTTIVGSGSKTTISTQYGPWLWGIVGGVVLVFGIVGAVIAAGRDVGISSQAPGPTPHPTQPLVVLHSSPPLVVTQTAPPTIKQATATTIPATATDVPGTATTISATVTNIPPTRVVAVVPPTRPISTMTPRPSTPTTKPTATAQVQLTATVQAQRAATVQAQHATAQVEVAQVTAQAQAQQQTASAQQAAQLATAQAQEQAAQQTVAAQATAAADQLLLDGSWVGTNSRGGYFSFTVRNKRVVSAMIELPTNATCAGQVIKEEGLSLWIDRIGNFGWYPKVNYDNHSFVLTANGGFNSSTTASGYTDVNGPERNNSAGLDYPCWEVFYTTWRVTKSN